MTATYLEKDLMWVWPTPHNNKLFANKTVLAFENSELEKTKIK